MTRSWRGPQTCVSFTPRRVPASILSSEDGDDGGADVAG